MYYLVAALHRRWYCTSSILQHPRARCRTVPYGSGSGSRVECESGGVAGRRLDDARQPSRTGTVKVRAWAGGRERRRAVGGGRGRRAMAVCASSDWGGGASDVGQREDGSRARVRIAAEGGERGAINGRSRRAGGAHERGAPDLTEAAPGRAGAGGCMQGERATSGRKDGCTAEAVSAGPSLAASQRSL